MKRWRLPKVIKLPGFTIKVEVGGVLDGSGEWSYSGDVGVLRLNKNLTINQQKYFFSHELLHAIIDYHHRMNEERGAL